MFETAKGKVKSNGFALLLKCKFYKTNVRPPTKNQKYSVQSPTMNKDFQTTPREDHAGSFKLFSMARNKNKRINIYEFN